MNFELGGMNVTTVLAVNTGQKLKGRNWEDKSLVEDACRLLLDDLPLSPSAPGGGAAYRSDLIVLNNAIFHNQIMFLYAQTFTLSLIFLQISSSS